MNVTPIKPGGDIKPVDDPKLASEMYGEIWDVIHQSKFDACTVAATLGVLALLSHAIITKPRDEP